MGTSRTVLPWSLRAALTWAVLAPATGMAQTAEIHGIGHLPGGVQSSFVYGLSGNGRVAVGIDTGLIQSAVRWSSIGGIGELPGPPGLLQAQAVAVSDDARVIVGSTGVRPPAGGFLVQPAVWVDGVYMPLPDLPGGLEGSSAALGVSGDGRVVVGESQDEVGTRAFRWTADQGMLPIPNNANVWPTAGADASHDGGVIIGSGVHAATRVPMGFRWTQAGGATPLPPVSPVFRFSDALATSGDGSVIVGYAWDPDNPPQLVGDACIWPASGNPFFLNAAQLGAGTFANANDVSADGRTVVGDVEFGGAFIWDAAHGARLLEDVLHDDYGLDLQGWSLSTASAISADGLAIGGYGINPAGEPEGYVVFIASPPGALLALLGVMPLIRRRR